MKRIVLIIIATAFISESFGFQTDEKPLKDTGQSIANSSQTVISENKVISRIEVQSPVLRNDKLSLLESLESNERDLAKYGTVTENRHYHDWQQENEEKQQYRGSDHFRGHWSGFEAGFNNYNYVSSMLLPDAISYMSLNATNSNCLNFNISQLNMGFSRRIGLVSGIGLNWNNYRFENSNSIEVGQDGAISELVLNSPVLVKKSRFSTLYLNVPLLLEIQIPAGFGNHLNVAAGVIGGIKLNAWTKLIYENGEKSRINGDYNLNLLRGGVTARVGWGNFMIYGTYYLTPWFQDLKGPNGFNLEPFEIGIAFTFND